MTTTSTEPPRLNLLREPLLTWRGKDRVRHSCTLPGLLAALSRGEVADFPHARAHQFHPWSMFLTQLAVLAMQDAGAAEPSREKARWLEWLLALSGGVEEAWCLVVPDLDKPAFMQPPVPEKSFDAWKKEVYETPDDLDVLIVGKNHDIKSKQLNPADIESWILALVTLQTMQGYLGPGNYGIVRMNSGTGSRPRVELAADGAPSTVFRRDVKLMLAAHSQIAH